MNLLALLEYVRPQREMDTENNLLTYKYTETNLCVEHKLFAVSKAMGDFPQIRGQKEWRFSSVAHPKCAQKYPSAHQTHNILLVY